MRPDRIGTILMEAHDSRRISRGLRARAAARVAPARVFAHLVAVAKTGRTVVAKAGLKSWRIFASGEWGPTV